MSLLVLMYHRAHAGRFGNPVAILDAHFAQIARNYSNVLPGQRLHGEKLNVCLTFDDAYFDFYDQVFPLLRRHQLRAVLAVPTAFIAEKVSMEKSGRSSMESDAAFADPTRSGFCTWNEIQEMVASGHVSIAAHGHTHCRLDAPSNGWATEIEAPRMILNERSGQVVDSFVFPFGRFSRASLSYACDRYSHVFRIGDAINRGWKRMLYRVKADEMKSPNSLFSPAKLTRYRTRYFWNRLRGR